MQAPDIKDLKTWIVSDGKVGMETQCLGLAESLGLDFEVKRIIARAPWSWLPPTLWRDPLRALSPKGSLLEKPWPDILIGTGRRAVAPVLAIRRASKGRSFAIQIQDPTVDPRRFDVVVAPRHDALAGENVISTLGSMHRVTAARLEEAGRRFAAIAAGLPEPRVAVLIGGPNKAYRFDEATMRRFADSLNHLAEQSGAGLLVTASRRTGAANEALLRRALQGRAAAIWDGHGENPYFGLLALADVVVVTSDSVNMVCEAAATGKPVLVFHLPGGSQKFAHFHHEMEQAGLTRPFAGMLERWAPPPFNETARAADLIRTRIANWLARREATGAPLQAGTN